MKRSALQLFWCLLLLSSSAFAAANDPRVQLEFVPQQAVAGAELTLRGELYDLPVNLVFSDQRPLEDSSELGVRTDDDDRRHTLTATAEVGAYVGGVLERVARERGLTIDAGAPRTLTVELRRFWIEETNQAVGATYNAYTDLTGRLTAEGGATLWSGAATGDASRYGRKFSNANCNEVLSDALLEAWAELLSNGELQAAWIGR